MKRLDVGEIDDALAALAFDEGQRGGAVRRKLSGVYILAVYDTKGQRPCRAFGASTSPHEVWFLDPETHKLIDHIDLGAEYGVARLSGYQVKDEAEKMAELEAAIARANRPAVGEGARS